MPSQEHPPLYWGKVPQPFNIHFESLRLAPFSLALHLCSSWLSAKWWKTYTITDSWFPISNEEFTSDNFRQAGESPKYWNSTGYIFRKTTFLQLKHCIQKIYLTLLSTICVKIHQIPYVIFETTSHFSRHFSIWF